MSGRSGTIGNWATAAAKLAALKSTLSQGMKNKLRDAAKVYLKKVVDHIMEQDLALESLADSTVARKGHGEYYYDWGWFVKRLKMKVLENRRNFMRIGAGAFEDIGYDGDVSMYDVAKWNEFGTKNIPSRPIFAITLMEVIQEYGLPDALGEILINTWKF